MKRIKFCLSSHYVGGTDLEEIFEFEDDITDKEIDEEFGIWVEENTTQDTHWEEIQHLEIECNE